MLTDDMKDAAVAGYLQAPGGVREWIEAAIKAVQDDLRNQVLEEAAQVADKTDADIAIAIRALKVRRRDV